MSLFEYSITSSQLRLIQSNFFLIVHFWLFSSYYSKTLQHQGQFLPEKASCINSLLLLHQFESSQQTPNAKVWIRFLKHLVLSTNISHYFCLSIEIKILFSVVLCCVGITMSLDLHRCCSWLISSIHFSSQCPRVLEPVAAALGRWCFTPRLKFLAKIDQNTGSFSL